MQSYGGFGAWDRAQIGDAFELEELSRTYRNIDEPPLVGSNKRKCGISETVSGLVSFMKAMLGVLLPPKELKSWE